MTPTRLPGGSVACTQGTCISALVATGTRDMRGQLALEQREEAAVGGDRLGALAPVPPRRRGNRGSSPAAPLQHHAFGRGALHHAVQHRERPGRGVAHVAGDAREPRLQHQDAERGAVARAVPPFAMLLMFSPSARQLAGNHRGAREWASQPRRRRHGRTSVHSGRPGNAEAVGHAHHLQRAGTGVAGAAVVRLHRRADGVRRSQAAADRRPGAHRPDPLPRSRRAGQIPPREDWYDYVEAADFPTIAVLQDIDDRPGYGAFWGEVQSNVHKGLGLCSAASPTGRSATSRCGRRLPDARRPHRSEPCARAHGPDEVPGEHVRHAMSGTTTSSTPTTTARWWCRRRRCASCRRRST